jgi:glucose-1-phosphate adenylyltransferase
VDIPITNALHSGVKRIFVLTQFNSATLHQHIKKTYPSDTIPGGFVEFLAAEQTPGNTEWYRGTADAVRQSLQRLHHLDYDYLLVLSGDQLYQMNFQPMIRQHISNRADVTIATIPVNARQATGFGIMKTSDEGAITDFIEKPASAQLTGWEYAAADGRDQNQKPYLASMGIYLFERKVLESFLMQHPQEHDFGKNIIPAFIQQGRRSISHIFPGYWTDIGTVSSYFEANIGLTDDDPEFNLHDPSYMIRNENTCTPAPKISGTTCDKAMISAGCMIRAKRITSSIIGPGTIIKDGTILDKVYVMGADPYNQYSNSSIGKNCRLVNMILCQNVSIGDYVILEGGDACPDMESEDLVIRDGIIVVKEGASIPDHFSLRMDVMAKV